MENTLELRRSQRAKLMLRDDKKAVRARNAFFASYYESKRSHLRTLLDEVLSARTKGDLTDEQTAEVLELVFSYYVQNELEARLSDRFSKALTNLNSLCLRKHGE